MIKCIYYFSLQRSYSLRYAPKDGATQNYVIDLELNCSYNIFWIFMLTISYC